MQTRYCKDYATQELDCIHFGSVCSSERNRLSPVMCAVACCQHERMVRRGRLACTKARSSTRRPHSTTASPGSTLELARYNGGRLAPTLGTGTARPAVGGRHALYVPLCLQNASERASEPLAHRVCRRAQSLPVHRFPHGRPGERGCLHGVSSFPTVHRARIVSFGVEMVEGTGLGQPGPPAAASALSRTTSNSTIGTGRPSLTFTFRHSQIFISCASYYGALAHSNELDGHVSFGQGFFAGQPPSESEIFIIGICHNFLSSDYYFRTRVC
jgi:hypothetical protein